MSRLSEKIAELRRQADALEARGATAPPRGTLVVYEGGIGVSAGEMNEIGELSLLLPEGQGVWVESGATADDWRVAKIGTDITSLTGADYITDRLAVCRLEGER